MTIYRIDLLSTIEARLIYEQYYYVCRQKDLLNLLAFTDIQMQSKTKSSINCQLFKQFAHEFQINFTLITDISFNIGSITQAIPGATFEKEMKIRVRRV